MQEQFRKLEAEEKERGWVCIEGDGKNEQELHEVVTKIFEEARDKSEHQEIEENLFL